jgi:hypothetical protein
VGGVVIKFYRNITDALTFSQPNKFYGLLLGTVKRSKNESKNGPNKLDVIWNPFTINRDSSDDLKISVECNIIFKLTTQYILYVTKWTWGSFWLFINIRLTRIRTNSIIIIRSVWKLCMGYTPTCCHFFPCQALNVGRKQISITWNYYIITITTFNII